MYIGEKKVEDWGIITAFTIGTPPVVKKEYEVPGRHGLIDASEAMTGYPIYRNRPVSIEIYIPGAPEEYKKVYDEIKDHCHGKKRAVVFDFDKEYYYEGRWNVGQNENARGYVTISADCYPYALKKDLTVIDISSAETTARKVVLPNAGMPTKLAIETDAEITIKRGNKSTTYGAGQTTVHAPLLIDDEVVTISGAANATISYQEGKI